MLRNIIVFCLLASLCGPTQAATLKIATLTPDGTEWMKLIRQAAAEVGQRTDNRVKFRFYPGGVMGNDQSVLRKIRIGQLHGGALSGGGLAQIHSDANVYGLAFTFQSYDEIDYVRKKMDADLLKTIEKAGFVGFGLTEVGFAYILSTAPVRTSADLRGRKVWIPEGDLISQIGLEALSVTPVPLPLTDVLTGLQTGLIDTVGNSPSGAIALQWHTKVKYMTDTPLFYLYGSLVIQNKVFKRLKRSDQTIVREVFGKLFKTLNQRNRTSNSQARQALQRQGIEIVVPTATERQALQNKVEPAMDQLGREGLFSPKTLATLRRHLENFRSGQR